MAQVALGSEGHRSANFRTSENRLWGSLSRSCSGAGTFRLAYRADIPIDFGIEMAELKTSRKQ